MSKHVSWRSGRASESGFTLIEMVVVLAIIALLAAILTPMVVKYVRDARLARAGADVRTIGAAIQRFEGDLARLPMFATATSLREGDATVSLLVGPGAQPDTTLQTLWASDAVDCGKGAGCVTDTLVDQLISNTPSSTTTTTTTTGSTTTTAAGTAYPTAPLPGIPQFWQGPYLNKLETDPWGNQYLVNIGTATSGGASASFVLSAGPNGKVETAFAILRSSFVTPGGDDIIFRIR